MTRHYLAVDIGAESGRAILGTLEQGILRLEELHRFHNTPVRVFSHLYWDVLRLFHEVQQGLRIAGRERRLSISGVGVDTWGVDFALLGEDGALVDNPRHYRDARTNGVMEQLFNRVPKARVFAETGIQFMQLNTLYQWFSMHLEDAPALHSARRLLMIPDLLNYWLTGVQKTELTIASTTQFYNPVKKRFSTELLDDLGLSPSILAEIVPPGALLGSLVPQVADFAGLSETPVFTTGCHDTASAVAAVPAEGTDWCYISSGTWSLMGVEIDNPVVNEKSLAMNLTNEVGAAGKIRLLKNIAGLWVIQECKRAWALAGTDYSYEELARMAADAKPFLAVINPDEFLEPSDMPARIAAYCRRTKQAEPASPGEFARVVFESLALRYRQVLEMLESLLGRSINVIHIVGGGSKNDLLNQLVADATGRRVVTGPTEATAAGNVLIQAIGAGALAGLEEARSVVRCSFPVRTFTPSATPGWDDAYRRFGDL